MKLDSSHFNTDHDTSTIEKVVAKGTNIEFFITPRFRNHYCAEEYEPFSISILKNYIKPNSTFVDIGAHYGYYSMVAGLSGKNISVFAVEPVSTNYEILKLNLEYNNIRTVGLSDVVVSDKSGDISFNITDASDSSGVYNHPLTHTREKLMKQAKTIDDMLVDVGDIDFIKIDVEGHEISVLDGMIKTIKRFRPRLIIEYNPKCQKMSGHEPIDLLNKIRSYNYTISVVNEKSKRLYRLDESFSQLKEHREESAYVNLLCVPEESFKLISFFAHTSGLSGAERSLLGIIKSLKENNTFSHVILPEAGPIEEMLDREGVPYDVVNLQWWASTSAKSDNEINNEVSDSLSYLSTYLLELKKINPDVIYSNTIVMPWGAIAAIHLKKTHIWHIREYGEKDHNLVFYLPYNDIIKFVDDNSDLVLANSKTLANYLKKILIKNNPKVIYSHIEIPDEPQNMSSKDLQYNDPEALKIMVCGTIQKGKKQMDVVRLINSLICEGLNVELVLLGGTSDVEYYLDIKKYIDEHKLHNVIHLIDFKSNPYPYLSAIDIVIVPSSYEAFGRTAIEAMLLKKTVIVAKSSGVSEIVKNGINGFTFTSGNIEELRMIIKQLLDKNIRQDIAMAGYKTSQYFNSRTAHAESLSKLLERTVYNPQSKQQIANKITSILIHSFQRINEEKTMNEAMLLSESRGSLIERGLMSDQQIKSIDKAFRENKILTKQIQLLTSDIRAKESQLNNIKSSIFYRTWQLFNKVKKIIK